MELTACRQQIAKTARRMKRTRIEQNKSENVIATMKRLTSDASRAKGYLKTCSTRGAALAQEFKKSMRLSSGGKIANIALTTMKIMHSLPTREEIVRRI
ncbi:hypothetical protein [Bradyrhizobium sp. Arg816]|uniref:hypothetical protein n=1 Tax=Bradyrhizobium sp. Arg816 TaxID=2998491 RepID=UPI00249F25A0|nr:hypothetical protein [Bradyrhizobium sp. Arg816]MDI3567393.1 hypothetical protein [Bradyrhizobium sp. Arg816]